MGESRIIGGGGMKNTAKAISDIGELIRSWGSSIDHRTYRDICDELASRVELSEKDITDEQYTEWWNGNISHHEDNW